MAHRVIAQWFVVCRSHCRPAVAKYINKTLTTDLSVTSRRPIGSQTTAESRANIGLELMEVCQDMMARFTYSNLSTLPSRYRSKISTWSCNSVRGTVQMHKTAI